MILTPPQAKATYDAMCALNNVSGLIDAQMHDLHRNTIHVVQTPVTGAVYVRLNTGGIVRDRNLERYETQGEFAEAYGLN